MKDGKKSDKFLPPHGMPSDDDLIRIFIEGIPYGFENQNPVKSWNYQLTSCLVRDQCLMLSGY